MKKMSAPKINTHPWKGKDAGSTAGRDWTVMFLTFLAGVLVAVGVQGFDFYTLVTDQGVVPSENTEETIYQESVVQKAHRIYQEKVRMFETETGVRM